MYKLLFGFNNKSRYRIEKKVQSTNIKVYGGRERKLTRLHLSLLPSLQSEVFFTKSFYGKIDTTIPCIICRNKAKSLKHFTIGKVKLVVNVLSRGSEGKPLRHFTIGKVKLNSRKIEQPCCFSKKIR